MFKQRCSDCQDEAMLSFGTKGNGKCSQCGGSGQDNVFEATIHNLFGSKYTCSNCKGTGVCPACKGKGIV